MYFGCKNLSVSYGKTRVLSDVTLDITPGLTTAIVGLNGSGKSTLLRALGRLTPADGEVILGDQPLSALTRRDLAKKIALLPQSALAPADITVYELIALGRFPHQGLMQTQLSADDKAFLAQLMADTQVLDLRNLKVSELSGGQRQRVFITMILAQDSEILLLDEPTTYLDLVHQLEILTLLKKCAAELGKTVVYVIHDLNQVARFADELVVLKNGVIAAKGKVSEVFTVEMIAENFGLTVQLGRDEIAGCPMITGIQNV